MKTFTVEPELTRKVQTAWEEFLLKPEGQAGISLLRRHAPAAPTDDKAEHIFVAHGAKLQGYNELLYQLIELANPENVKSK